MNSEYIVSEGHYDNFIVPFGKLIAEHQKLRTEADLVVLTDGATWMRQWTETSFPGAVHILDFYHAYEHLCEFARLLIEDEDQRRAKREG